jgi:hypothetical protein
MWWIAGGQGGAAAGERESKGNAERTGRADVMREV